MIQYADRQMLYLPIRRNWIVSPAANRTYFACAVAAFSLVGLLISSLMALGYAGIASFASSPAAALVVRFLLWPGMIGTALLCVAMWYFWFNFDDSSWFRKALWFIFLYFTILVGPAFYYFLVYRRSSAVRTGL